MFSATYKVINIISKYAANYSWRGDTKGVYLALTSFEFVFILYLMKQIMGITNVLCPALQQHEQDIVNAISLISFTKSLI